MNIEKAKRIIKRCQERGEPVPLAVVSFLLYALDSYEILLEQTREHLSDSVRELHELYNRRAKERDALLCRMDEVWNLQICLLDIPEQS